MTYDICIIGSGPAGLTLCAELANSDKKICVIESGGLNKSKYADDLREIKTEGDIKIKTNSRERILGGTSTTWFGISAPLDKIDFDTWPTNFEDLKPYYAKASAYGFPELKDFDAVFNLGFRFGLNKIKEKVFIYPNKPWNFGQKLKYIFDKPNVDLYTNSTLTDISKSNSEITHIKVIDLDKNEYKIYAKIFVLAAGGIENARLLLLSNLGNENDQVGRYITNHPKNTFGTIRLNKSNRNLSYLFGYKYSNWNKYVGLRIDEKSQRSLGILNSYVRLEPSLPNLYSKVIYRLFKVCRNIKIRNFMEMEPRPENRIVLSDESDINGKQLAKVILNTSHKDERSVIELHRVLAHEIKNKNIGILKSNIENANPWPIVTDASHHLGGTIMGNDPRKSVVDKDLKIHSIENLYVCGGSVFPTSGNANPTYTICALAIRLALKLKNL